MEKINNHKGLCQNKSSESLSSMFGKLESMNEKPIRATSNRKNEKIQPHF